MIKLRLVLILFGAAGVAGCAADNGYVGRYGAAALVTSPAVRSTPSPIASAFLPAEAGRVIAVRQTEYANGIRQQIVFDGFRSIPGENTVTIAALLPPGRAFEGAREDILHVERPSVEAVEGELATAFPGITMTISPEVGTNPQGAFGYASGRSGSATCLYAWQYVAPDRPLTLAEGALALQSYPYSVRLRLCRSLPQERLVSFARALVVRHLGLGEPDAGPTPDPAAGGPAAGDALDVALGRPQEPSAFSDPASPSRSAAQRPRSAPRGRAARKADARLKHGRNRDKPVGANAALAVPLPEDVRGERAVPAPGVSAQPPTDELPLPRSKNTP